MRWTSMLMAMVLCGGCLGQCGVSEDTGEPCAVAADLYIARYRSIGEAPWDGVNFELREPDCEAGVLAADPAVSLARVDDELFPVVPTDDCSARWVGQDELPEGIYDQVVVHDVDHGTEGVQDLTFPLETAHVVGNQGRDPAFSPDGLAGKAFRLDADTIQSCDEAVALVGATLLPGPAWFEILGVKGEQLTFRMIQELDDYALPACVYLEDQGTLSVTGEFTWQRDQLALATDPAIESWDLAMRMGLDASATEVAGLELGATIDLVNVVMDDPPDSGAEVTWEDSCALLSGFGLDCEPCEHSDLESCLALHFYGAQASLVELPYDTKNLPDCEVALDLPSNSCELSCSTSSPRHLSALFLGLLGLVLVRRRRV